MFAVLLLACTTSSNKTAVDTPPPSFASPCGELPVVFTVDRNCAAFDAGDAGGAGASDASASSDAGAGVSGATCVRTNDCFAACAALKATATSCSFGTNEASAPAHDTLTCHVATTCGQVSP